ncbi:MAG: class I SAM-dependent methyltransferase [Pseudomonadota bacterium]
MGSEKFSLWRKFADKVPYYLAKHYWWAYLWRPSVWFFDHKPIINAILFGQYPTLLRRVLQILDLRPSGNLLQLTCAYGDLTPAITQKVSDQSFFICDVASIQLVAMRRKLTPDALKKLYITRMNAEKLGFKSDAFSTVLIFFLLHELPTDARLRVLEQVMRVIKPGGQLIVAEYAHQPTHHFLYRVRPLRGLLTRLEPFLGDFWRLDLLAALRAKAASFNKKVQCLQEYRVFNGFYRVVVYQVQ